MSRAMMICVLGTSLAVSVGCSAQSPRVIAQKLSDRLDQATANRDLNQVLGFYDSSYVLTDERGKRVDFAEFRRQSAQNFPLFRDVHPRTTVEDVQLEGARMIVYYKFESHFEYHGQKPMYGYDWHPMNFRASGESTWERKGDQWKIVRETTLRVDAEVDPEWIKVQERIIDKFSNVCPCR